MLRTRYRVVVDLEVQFDDVSLERSLARAAERRADLKRREWPGHSVASREPNMPSASDVDAARALQLELLSDPVVLDHWLQRLALIRAAEELAVAAEATETTREPLHPSVERLPPKARHWWRQTLYGESDEQFERIDHLYDCLDMQAGPVTVFEVEDTA